MSHTLDEAAEAERESILRHALLHTINTQSLPGQRHRG
ncbi:hypothetical protein [Streptomyces sp. KM273126]|nr:hypothetical protein [Streptomyces sp. KM273126]